MLRGNRDFNLLWSGQVLSDIGSRVSGIAFPLLVLAETGSPARAGVVGAVGALPLLLITLPAGAYIERWNQKTVMLLADAARFVAIGSIAVVVLAGRVVFGHIVLAALVEGIGFVFFGIAERASVPRLVADDDLPEAMARNQARIYTALLAGQPLGGVLYGIARAVPFAFDALSYLASVATVAAIRTPFVREPCTVPTRMRDDLREGLWWFWRQPFLRMTSLVVTGTDFVINCLYLVVIVIERQRGASGALIGVTFVFLGVGGILGSAVATRLARRMPLRAVVVGVPLSIGALLPLLVVLPGRATPAAVYGAMFLLLPTWNATVGALRLRLTPERLQARVNSVATLLALGLVPLAALFGGFAIERLGQVPTVSALVGVAAAATLVASRAAPAPSRRAPAP